MKRFYVKSLGCKANLADGQELEAQFSRQGWIPTVDPSQADLVVVNSCSVTDEASKQSKKFAKDFSKLNPNARVVYAGCDAEVDPEAALRSVGVHAVLGNQNKDRAADLIESSLFQSPASTEGEAQLGNIWLGAVRAYEEFSSRHPQDREWPMPTAGVEGALALHDAHSHFKTRAFLKIQDGCNSFCTYCIIPYGRGPNRSLKIEAVVEQVRSLVAQGVREVVLTGINIGDYGLDWSGKLEIDALLEAILTQTSLERLRVGSLDPTEISPRMIELMETYESFCPHFHVSLQHTSDKILKLMKRKYSSQAVVECLERIAKSSRPHFVGMDFITGFPGETDQDFEESYQRLSQLPWTRLHVFPYSERQSTPATKLPGGVPVSVRRERARRLQALSLERMQSVFSANLQTTRLDRVLFEGEVRGPDGTRNWIGGYTPHYQRVLVPKSETVLRNQVGSVEAKTFTVDRAAGEVMWIAEKTNTRLEARS